MMKRTVKWGLITLLVMGLLLGGARLYSDQIANPRVTKELLTNPAGSRAQIVMLLNLPSGRQLPVNYLREGNLVFVGADGPWWREFEPEPKPVQLWIQGEILHGSAATILDDPGYTNSVFARLRPTVPAWLPDWLNGKLVVITLQQPTG